MSVVAHPPAPWRFEQQGLSASAVFTHPCGSFLIWCDGQWMFGRGGHAMPARGVPAANSLKDARQVGSAWLHTLEDGS